MAEMVEMVEMRCGWNGVKTEKMENAENADGFTALLYEVLASSSPGNVRGLRGGARCHHGGGGSISISLSRGPLELSIT